MKNEVRHIEGVKVETRANADGTTTDILKGTSVVFNTLSRALVDFGDGTKLFEVVSPSAFDGCDMSDCLCQVDHEEVIGRTLSGTLRISLDTKGLHWECDVPDTQDGRDAVTMVKRGDLRGCSFMWPYGAWDYDYHVDDQGNYIRTIKSIKVLKDVGPVYNPAYTETSVMSTNKRDYIPENANEKPDAYKIGIDYKRQMLNLKSK